MNTLLFCLDVSKYTHVRKTETFFLNAPSESYNQWRLLYDEKNVLFSLCYDSYHPTIYYDESLYDKNHKIHVILSNRTKFMYVNIVP